MDEYTPEQIECLEYEAWINNQDEMTDEEYDEMMSSQYENYQVGL